MKTYLRVRFHQQVLPNSKTSLLLGTSGIRAATALPI